MQSKVFLILSFSLASAWGYAQPKSEAGANSSFTFQIEDPSCKVRFKPRQTKSSFKPYTRSLPKGATAQANRIKSNPNLIQFIVRSKPDLRNFLFLGEIACLAPQMATPSEETVEEETDGESEDDQEVDPRTVRNQMYGFINFINFSEEQSFLLSATSDQALLNSNNLGVGFGLGFDFGSGSLIYPIDLSVFAAKNNTSEAAETEPVAFDSSGVIMGMFTTPRIAYRVFLGGQYAVALGASAPIGFRFQKFLVDPLGTVQEKELSVLYGTGGYLRFDMGSFRVSSDIYSLLFKSLAFQIQTEFTF